jgi:hypothetical protein
MEIAFGVALLVLAGAVVLLFAMFGELASRVGEPEENGRWTGTRPLEEARLGAQPSRWPPELSAVGNAPQGLLLVLSPSCGSCQEVARQLVLEGGPSPARPFALAVSCSAGEVGRNFIEEQSLEPYPHFIDEAGEWVRTELDVHSSPVGLFFADGRLVAAHVFGDVNALNALAESIFAQPEPKRQEVKA